MSVQLPPVAVGAGDGQHIALPTGDSITIKAGTGETRGALSVFESVHAPRSGPPKHTHRREDELWWVLDGCYRFQVGDDFVDLERGGMAFGPRDVPHAFQNTGDTPGRLLVIATPAGIEEFFERSAALRATAADPEQIAEVASAFGIDFIGPPL